MQESRCPHDVNIEESTELTHRLLIRTSTITGLPALINALLRVAFLRLPVCFTHSFSVVRVPLSSDLNILLSLHHPKIMDPYEDDAGEHLCPCALLKISI